MVIQPETSRRQQVADRAALIVRTVKHTHYQHNPVIDPATGTYDLDCSEFVSYVLNAVAPEHYVRIPKEPSRICPLAFEFCDYFRSLVYDETYGWRRSSDVDGALVYEGAQGWKRVARLSEARRGDVIAWRFPHWAAGTDTGHVFIVAEKPAPAVSGLTALRVFDSSTTPHFDDSREQGGTFESGVGRGTIMFHVDRAGAPTAFQFGPGDRFHAYPIVIGRLEPFSR